jgi:hypothetical protein
VTKIIEAKTFAKRVLNQIPIKETKLLNTPSIKSESIRYFFDKILENNRRHLSFSSCLIFDECQGNV